MRVYLAGPDVFLPDPHARGAALKRICARHGLTGVFPLDALADEPAQINHGTERLTLARSRRIFSVADGSNSESLSLCAIEVHAQPSLSISVEES